MAGLLFLLVAIGGAAIWWQRQQVAPATEPAATMAEPVPAAPLPDGAASATAPPLTPAPIQPAPPATAAAKPGAPPTPGGASAKPTSPAAANPAAANRTPDDAPGLATPLQPPSPQPAPPRATPEPPPAEAVETQVFRNVRLVRQSGPELDVEVHLRASDAAVTNLGGRVTLHALPYGAISAAEYHESTHQRVFVRTTRYWLLLKQPGGAGVLLRLERDTAKPFLAAFERRWGRQVDVLAPEQEKEER
jgi:hypothetical protein